MRGAPPVIAFAEPEDLQVIQSHTFLEGISYPFDRPFSYDIAMPSDEDGEMHAEVNDITSELIEDDVYRLTKTGPGDIWVDAGSHVGLFSMAVMMAGAEVAALIDMDGELAWCAWQNVSAMRLQLQRRGVQRQNGVVPQVAAEEIRAADFLVSAAMMAPKTWEGFKRACLKLDIQGAERAVFDDGGAAKLAEAYDYMVVEWHYDDDISAMLEAAGWEVHAVASHVDVLLNKPTHIFWATSG